MTNQDYNLRVTASDGTKLKAIVNPTCAGCYLYGKDDCGNFRYQCRSGFRLDNSEIIWARVEKEQPIPKHDPIKEIRAKILTLEKEIYKLVKAFESDTGMVVHGINLVHAKVIGEASTTYNIGLDVRLN